MITVMTENKDYFIRISRSKKAFTFNCLNYNQYDYIVEFVNNMNMTVLKLTMNELKYLDCINNFNYFVDNGGGIISDNIWLDEDKDGRYFISIGDAKYGELYDDYIGESDPYRIAISIFQKTIMGNKLRLFFYCSYEGLYKFLELAYTLIADLPYLEDLSREAIANMINNGMM